MTSRLISATLLLSTLIACTTGDKASGAPDSVAFAAGKPDSVAQPTEEIVLPPENNPPPSPTAWQVTPAGIGPVRAGMSLDEANAVVGNSLVIPAKLSECDYVRSKNAPKGVSFMVENGKIARVDIRDDMTVKTAAGAGIGDTEERIKSLYPGQVAVQPHKYTSGHYLVVSPKSANDADMRLVFETESNKVTRFRSGKLPAVQYVEGCS